MKAILFLSFLIFFADVAFSTPSGIYIIFFIVIIIYFCVIFAETAENIETAFQTVDDGDTENSGMCKY